MVLASENVMGDEGLDGFDPSIRGNEVANIDFSQFLAAQEVSKAKKAEADTIRSVAEQVSMEALRSGNAEAIRQAQLFVRQLETKGSILQALASTGGLHSTARAAGYGGLFADKYRDRELRLNALKKELAQVEQELKSLDSDIAYYQDLLEESNYKWYQVIKSGQKNDYKLAKNTLKLLKMERAEVIYDAKILRGQINAAGSDAIKARRTARAEGRSGRAARIQASVDANKKRLG